MLTCPRCHTPIGVTDCYCSHCGKTLQPRMGFWYGHGGILLLTLLAGPFSLICVWMSHKISLTAKWLWTLFITAATVYLCYCTFKTFVMLQQVLLTF